MGRARACWFNKGIDKNLAVRNIGHIADLDGYETEMFNLSSKCAVVTGAARGLGQAIEASGSGADVALCDLHRMDYKRQRLKFELQPSG